MESDANLTRCDTRPPPVLFSTVVPVLFSIVVLLGLLGNALVIAVVASNSHMRSTTNILITSLALADLLFITLCVPFTALFYVFGWVFGHALCVLFQYFTFVPVYCSVYTLVLMSADRYLAVVHPIRSMAWRTKRNTLAAVAITWLAVALAHAPLAMDVGVVPVLRCTPAAAAEDGEVQPEGADAANGGRTAEAADDSVELEPLNSRVELAAQVRKGGDLGADVD